VLVRDDTDAYVAIPGPHLAVVEEHLGRHQRE